MGGGQLLQGYGMEYRTLGRTGIEVSLICLDTMTNKAVTKAHT